MMNESVGEARPALFPSTPEVAPWVETAPTALRFCEDTPFEIWAAVTDRLLAVQKGIDWWVADALNFGERRYGEKYTQMLEATGYAYSTLANAAWVGRRFEPSRRRENLPFGFHLEVAKLEPEVADELLDRCEQDVWTRARLRVAAGDEALAIERAKAHALPPPPNEQLPPDVRVLAGDARRLPLEDGAVDLTVTSPPYGLDQDYAGGDDSAEGWLELIGDALAEIYRVTKDGGRLALNVPLDTTAGGFRPTYAQAVAAAMKIGWNYRSSVVWAEETISHSVGRGSVDSAAAPHVIAPVEMVALFSKGPWKRQGASDLGHQEWLSWTNGLWRFGGESRPWEGHPAAFPEELPRRLIKLLSFPGDLVLDPFCGSSTTGIAAARLGRRYVGVDVVPAYAASSQRRFVAVFGGPR